MTPPTRDQSPAPERDPAFDAAIREDQVAVASTGVIGVPLDVIEQLVKLSAVSDPDAPIITGKKGSPEPDPELERLGTAS